MANENVLCVQTSIYFNNCVLLGYFNDRYICSDDSEKEELLYSFHLVSSNNYTNDVASFLYTVMYTFTVISNLHRIAP